MSSTLPNLKLLSHFNGSDGAISFTDDSVYGVTVTNNSKASCELDTAVKKFGSASLLVKYTDKGIVAFSEPSSFELTGHGLASGDQITMYNWEGNFAYKQLTVNTVVDSDNFTVVEDLTGYSISVSTPIYYHHPRKVTYPLDASALSNKFTFRFWFRYSQYLNTSVLVYLDNDTQEFEQTPQIELCSYSSSTNKIYAFGTDLVSTTTLSEDTWYFVEVGYDGINGYLFIDGVLEDSAETDQDYSLSDCDVLGLGPKHYDFVTGVSSDNAMYIDDFQFWDGVCLNSLANGYTVPSAEYSDSVGISAPSMNLQTEISANQIGVSSLNLQTEISANQIGVSSLNLQVEVIEGALGRLKRYEGGAWTVHQLKRYEGGSWTSHSLKHWNGSAWE